MRALVAATRDWEPVLHRMQEQGLLYRFGALTLAAPELPREVRAQVTRARSEQTAWTMFALADLARLTRALQDAGVDALVLKGPALSLLQHGTPCARSFSDLDVLVKRSARHRAAAVLHTAGYKPDWPVAPRAGSPFRYSSAVSFRLLDRASVDLHWGTSTPLVPFHLDQAGIWSRAQALDLGNTSCRSLGTEDALLHLCVHAAKDDWTRWSQVGDISAFLAAQPGLDFDLVRALARKTGTTRILGAALALASDLAEMRLPEEIWRWVCRDRRARGIAASAAADLRRGEARSQSIRARLARALASRERRNERVRLLLGAATRASEPRPGEAQSPWTWAIRRPLRLWKDLRADDRPPLGGTDSGGTTGAVLRDHNAGD